MKLKKWIVAGLLFAMLLTVSGCGRNALGSDGGTGAKADTAAGDANVTGGQPIVIKIGHTDSETRSTHVAALEFKQYMEENTDGRVQVEVYPNGQLGDDEDLVKAINLGTCQIYIGAQGTVSGLLGPQMDIFDLPFLYGGYEQWCEGSFQKGGLDLYNQQLAASGYVSLDFEYDGMRNILTSKKPIHTTADLAGLKIRVNNNDLYLSTYKALDANPTPMAFGEVYTGLSQGTVEGVDHVPGVIVDQKFYEPCKYLTLSNHIISPLVVLSSTDFVDSLPADIKEVFLTGIKNMAATQREMEYQAEQNSIKTLEENGIEVITLSEEERAAFEKETQVVYDQWRKSVGDELIDQVLSIAGK